MGHRSSAPTLITDSPEPWDERLVPRVLCFEFNVLRPLVWREQEVKGPMQLRSV